MTKAIQFPLNNFILVTGASVVALVARERCSE